MSSNEDAILVMSTKVDVFKGLHGEGDMKDMMERKIPTLPTSPSNQQLDGKNYSTLVVSMEAMLESYNLAFMVLQGIP